MKPKNDDFQNSFLAHAKHTRCSVTVYFVNGYQMHGVIEGFDTHTVLLSSGGKDCLIYKHAISTIALTQSDGTPREEQ